MSNLSEGFPSEADLTEAASRSDYLAPLINESQFIAYELDGLFGIPDLVTANLSYRGGVEGIAFEMKLSKWKRALQQAFHYRAFAREAYVVMDREYVHRPLRYADKFREAKVGLISVDSEQVSKCHIQAINTEPYSTHLTEDFRQIVMQDVRKKQLTSWKGLGWDTISADWNPEEWLPANVLSLAGV